MTILSKIKGKAASLYYAIGLVLLLLTNTCLAETIKIFPNTVISFPKTYSNVTLDMSHGNFIVKGKASLTIKNCIVQGTLSKETPVLISVENGTLNIDSSQVSIQTVDLPQHPFTQSLQYVVQLGFGNVSFSNSNFKIDQTLTAGLLITTSTTPTTGLKFTNNTFEQFHGVLYLIASDNSLVSDNTFKRNSYGQIVIMGNNSNIIHNYIYFSGNYHLGNSIDILDSSNVSIRRNLLFTPTCHGIYVMNSHTVLIDGNRVSGGITYAVNVLSYPETAKGDDAYLTDLLHQYRATHNTTQSISNNIIISNNVMSQNRYGIAVSDTDALQVRNNIFIQRFTDAESRKFWTNNAVLLQNVTNLAWTENLYKEAYTQEINGDNSQSGKFVVFPQTGGVVLS